MSKSLFRNFPTRLQWVYAGQSKLLCGLGQSRCAWIVLIVLFGAGQLHAQNLPFVNTGITSFMDGMPAPLGWKYQQYVVFATADRINNANGNEVSGLPDVDLMVFASQLSYTTKQKVLLGARLDVTAVQLFILDDLKFHADGTGIGDLFVGASFQWDPIVIDGKPVFSHRLEFDGILPVGRYDSNRLNNPSSNYYSINPYWAATVFLAERWTVSSRLHYLWNAPNDDPNKILFPGAGSTQAGQAFHMNFATSYGVTRLLRAGVAGFYLKQVTDSKVDGLSVSGTRQEVLALGPGLFFEVTPESIMVMNAYFDVFSKNRPQGMLFVYRVAFVF